MDDQIIGRAVLSLATYLKRIFEIIDRFVMERNKNKGEFKAVNI